MEVGNCGLNIGNSLHNGAEIWEDNFRGEDNAFGATTGKMDNNTLDRRRPKRAKSSRNRIIQKLFQIFPSKKILDILHPKFRPILAEIELKGNFMKISYCRTLIYSLVTAASAIAANAENLSLITGENKALTATG